MNTINADVRATVSKRRPAGPLQGVAGAIMHLFVRRILTVWTLVFSVGFPILMYLIFGVGKEYSDTAMPHGNVAGMIMVNMAQYSAVIVASMITASIALERQQGWLRTMGLTPLGTIKYVAVKIAVSILVVVVSVGAIYAVGFFTQAKMDASVWLQTLLLIVVLSLLPATLGLLCGLAIGGQEAYGVLGGGTALLAFLSGMFVPLEQLAPTFQKIAEWTPLWGINRLTLTPFFGWSELQWKFVANVGIWFIVLLVLCWLAARRPRSR